MTWTINTPSPLFSIIIIPLYIKNFYFICIFHIYTLKKKNIINKFNLQIYFKNIYHPPSLFALFFLKVTFSKFPSSMILFIEIPPPIIEEFSSNKLSNTLILLTISTPRAPDWDNLNKTIIMIIIILILLIILIIILLL